MTNKMLKTLHPDAVKALVGGNMIVDNSPLEADIGKVVKFKNWNKNMGTLKRDHTYTIIGVQKIYDGRISYRATCNGIDDTFGCPALPDEVEFVPK